MASPEGVGSIRPKNVSGAVTMANKPSKIGSLTDRPKKSRNKQEEAEVENTYEDETILDVYEKPKSAKELFLQIAVMILTVAFVVTSSAMCIVSPPAQQNPQQAQQQQVDDTAQQIENFSKKLNENPEDVATLANLGFYLGKRAGNTMPTEENKVSRMTDLATAEGHLRKALEIDPKYTFAQMELARNLLMQEKSEEARTFINDALAGVEEKLSSDDEKEKNKALNNKVELIRLLAGADISEQKYSEALPRLDEAIGLKPGDANLYISRSQVYQLLGDKEKATKDLEIVIEIGQKTQNPQVAAFGQALLEQLNNPQPAPTPGASEAPATSETPAAVSETPAAVSETPSAVSETPSAVSETPSAVSETPAPEETPS